MSTPPTRSMAHFALFLVTGVAEKAHIVWYRCIQEPLLLVISNPTSQNFLCVLPVMKMLDVMYFCFLWIIPDSGMQGQAAGYEPSHRVCKPAYLVPAPSHDKL